MCLPTYRHIVILVCTKKLTTVAYPPQERHYAKFQCRTLNVASSSEFLTVTMLVGNLKELNMVASKFHHAKCLKESFGLKVKSWRAG
jgi:hypothetical protein